MNFNEIIIFIGGIIMAISFVALMFLDDPDSVRVGWCAVCLGVCIIGIGAALNMI